MNISERGINALKLFEGCKKRGDLHYAYQCDAGVWTCGYGSTGGVSKDTIWTEDQARAGLLRDILSAETAVRKQCDTSKLTQAQYDALVSFVFNLGPRPQATLWKKIATGDMKGAADELLKWNLVGGKPNAGVARRRQAEREMFLNGKYPENW